MEFIRTQWGGDIDEFPNTPPHISFGARKHNATVRVCDVPAMRLLLDGRIRDLCDPVDFSHGSGRAQFGTIISASEVLMPTEVTIRCLADTRLERLLCSQIKRFMEPYPGNWGISVLGSNKNDIWELKIKNPAQGEWVKSLYREDRTQTIEKVMEEIASVVNAHTAKSATA